MEALLFITIGIALCYFIKGVKYFCKAFYRFFKPMFIMLFFGVDKALQSEVERTESYKRFEDELKDLTK